MALSKQKIKNAQQYLLSYGIRPSVQRLSIMEYLLSHKTHPTADEIYVSLSKTIPTLSKMTVYNTLNMLSEAGAILSLDIDEKNKRFDGDNSFHAHFYCKSCGRVEDIFFDNTTKKYDDISFDGEVHDIQISIKGKCKNCIHS